MRHGSQRPSRRHELLLSALLILGTAQPVRAAEAPLPPSPSSPDAPTSPPAPDGRSLAIQSGYLAGLSLVGIGILWSMPPEDSQWYEKPKLAPDALYKSWRKNVAHGPVWDGDMRVFNGYGHIHSGASYTVLCLETGATPLGCTIYANAASLIWEFGPEALVELPSWQDILMTGLVGSRVGMQFFAWRRGIAAHGGELLGSHALGTLASFVLDPFGSATRGLQRLLHAHPTPVASMLTAYPTPRGAGWSLALDARIPF
jgi:hypothetical protein